MEMISLVEQHLQEPRNSILNFLKVSTTPEAKKVACAFQVLDLLLQTKG
jgi:hypothetical protein